MKIITWNCNMAFRKKAEVILEEIPDLLIVPESEHPDKLKFKNKACIPNDIFWLGDNRNKGLGIYSYSDLRIEKMSIHNPEFRYIIPLKINGNNISFILLASWCQKPLKSDNYGLQTWNAIHYYKKLLREEKIIIAGDFNSNSIWDKPKRKANHSNIVSNLKAIGIESSYHVYNNENQGKESSPTLFLYKKKERPYHIDYCFISEFFLRNLKSVKIGRYEKWIDYSDHCPLIVEFDL